MVKCVLIVRVLMHIFWLGRKQWFQDNIVACVMIFSALLWIPGMLIINRYDNRMVCAFQPA